MEINVEQFKIWIAALRSGDYQQTTGTLENRHGFCCLGVACKVLIPEDKMLFREGILRTKVIAGGDPICQHHAPDWLKLINDDFERRHGKGLITLNDDDKLTFNQIADLLEKYYIPNGN